MTGEYNQPDYSYTGYHIGDWAKSGYAFLLLLLDHSFDCRQEERQPGGGGDDHGEDDAYNHEATELKGDTAEESGHRPQLQYAAEQIGVDPGDGQLDRGEPPECYLDRKEVEECAQGVGDTGLAGGEEGGTGKQLRVPERNLILLKCSTHMQFPDCIFEDQVAQQLVMRCNAGLQ